MVFLAHYYATIDLYVAARYLGLNFLMAQPFVYLVRVFF
jgi:hypothetical protein